MDQGITQALELEPGQRNGELEILGVLGRGGFARVFAARIDLGPVLPSQPRRLVHGVFDEDPVRRPARGRA